MRALVSAEILAVGSELLTPYRIDTNSLFVTARLNDAGIDLRTKSVVGDDARELEALFRLALSPVDGVVLTGGLGPTADDVTRESVASALGWPLDESPEILETIRQRFTRRGLAMPEINRRQAHVPRGATVLANSKGTAPGLWLDVDGQVVVLLPGPPRELEPMWEGEVHPRLLARPAVSGFAGA